LFSFYTIATAPGRPTAAAATPGGVAETSVTLTWTYGSQGTPVENYQIRCFLNTGPTTPACTSTTGLIASAFSSRTALGASPSLTVSGLTGGTAYYCYVRASNVGGGICSEPALSISTKDVEPSPPGGPAAGVIGATSASVSFALSATPGVPPETYFVRCYKNGGAGSTCNDALGAGDVESAGVPRPASGPVVVEFGPIGPTALEANTLYTCLVAAR
jgi:hypothetical protein